MTLWYILYINNTEKADGTLTPVRSNPAVPVELLKKVQDLLKGGISIEDIVDRLRTETVPKGYPCHPWRSGMYTCIIMCCMWKLCTAARLVVCVLHVCCVFVCNQSFCQVQDECR